MVLVNQEVENRMSCIVHRPDRIQSKTVQYFYVFRGHQNLTRLFIGCSGDLS